jgi:Rab GDP dissociation inhibitor
MEEEYDVVVCGTGFKECILSGMLSVSGKKVLHVDRNDYYGADSASVNLTTLYQKFDRGAPPPEFGPNRDWNIDLIPKFVMASGKLVSILMKSKVSRYLEWKSVEGSYVYQYQAGGLFSSEKFIHKVPVTAEEALTSPLMSLLEKNRFKNFAQFVMGWDAADPSSFKGFDPQRHAMCQVYEKFGLQPSTQEFLGHAVALHTNDDYLRQPCGKTIEKIKLYIDSFFRYGGSPFIYPIYGLGGLPEGFSRLAAIHNGTYMLHKNIDGFEFDESGKVVGVRSGDEVAKCKLVICDPSYAPPEKKTVVAKLIRSICILGAPIPNTNNNLSCQVVLPQRELGRRNDIFISMVSWAHCVAHKDKYIAIVSTTVETGTPEKEIEPALRLLGPILAQFTSVSDLCVPTDDGRKDNVFVTASYDPLSHFEQETEEVLAMWKTITGADLDLQLTPEEIEAASA